MTADPMGGEERVKSRICEGCGGEFQHRAPGSYTDEDGCDVCPGCAADLRLEWIAMGNTPPAVIPQRDGREVEG
jgi:hypothetical protein